jgi:hypothetical protein
MNMRLPDDRTRPADNGDSWPETGEGLQVDVEQLRLVVKQLRDDLETYGDGASGMQHNLRQRGNIDERQLGSFPAARGYHKSLMSAMEQIGHQFGEFTAVYGQFIDGLARVTQNYAEAEQNTLSAIAAVQWALGQPQPQSGDKYLSI